MAQSLGRRYRLTLHLENHRSQDVQAFSRYRVIEMPLEEGDSRPDHPLIDSTTSQY